ncbi:MAG TPA: TlpA disulfide reductase family protein [Anaerolineaceae bacterium]|nr:TlpA disulfide reductase family protein [Anaerolineaceae bacterium]
MTATLRRHWNAFSLIILALAAGWIVLTAFVAPDPTQGRIPAPRPGFLAPDFELQTLDGDDLRLGEQQGRPIILNLWASWCPPCKAEMPALQQVHEDYAAEGLLVVGLNTSQQDRLADVQRFVGEYRLTFPILLDLENQATRVYGTNALPTTYFIRADGTIADLVIGGPLSEALLRSKAEELLQEAR